MGEFNSRKEKIKMLRRTPRFSRTRMNESSFNGSADYGKFAYNWNMMYDEFEMPDDLNKQIQNVMNQDANFPNVRHLEKLLSDTFDTKMEINSCSVRSKKAFSLSFIGRYAFFEITVNF